MFLKPLEGLKKQGLGMSLRTMLNSPGGGAGTLRPQWTPCHSGFGATTTDGGGEGPSDAVIQ